MRFISCYVSGFGTLSQRTFDLSKDIVEIKLGNGEGKTTLAVFLESMLFGLETSRSKSLEENPRLKYERWQGGAFGGTLTFTHGGKTYRLERTFGKTPAQDTVKLFGKDNLPSYDFGENIQTLGELLLGVDRTTYRKSAYIAQGESSPFCVTEDAKARLVAMLSQRTDKETGASLAVKRLDEAERKLRARRAPAKGKLDELDEQIERLQRAQDDCRRAKDEAQELKRQIAERQNQLSTPTPQPPPKRPKLRLWLALALIITGAVAALLSPAVGTACIVLGICTLLLPRKRTKPANDVGRVQTNLEIARLELRAEEAENRAYALADYQAESERLQAEKSRLETRLAAIIAAKRFLLAARSNLASCYLSPVEEKCEQYAHLLGFSEGALRFDGAGNTLVEQDGSFRQTAYFSAGAKDLIGLCARLALAECVFETRSTPVLVLDDPLVNLDDEKTRLAKKLIRALSKRYQIVYFTCKDERRL